MFALRAVANAFGAVVSANKATKKPQSTLNMDKVLQAVRRKVSLTAVVAQSLGNQQVENMKKAGDAADAVRGRATDAAGASVIIAKHSVKVSKQSMRTVSARAHQNAEAAMSQLKVVKSSSSVKRVSKVAAAARTLAKGRVAAMNKRIKGSAMSQAANSASAALTGMPACKFYDMSASPQGRLRVKTTFRSAKASLRIVKRRAIALLRNSSQWHRTGLSDLDADAGAGAATPEGAATPMSSSTAVDDIFELYSEEEELEAHLNETQRLESVEWGSTPCFDGTVPETTPPSSPDSESAVKVNRSLFDEAAQQVPALPLCEASGPAAVAEHCWALRPSTGTWVLPRIDEVSTGNFCMQVPSALELSPSKRTSVVAPQRSAEFRFRGGA